MLLLYSVSTGITPFVWVMYVLFNRDMEPACDESVIRRLEERSKSTYAADIDHLQQIRLIFLYFVNFITFKNNLNILKICDKIKTHNETEYFG